MLKNFKLLYYALNHINFNTLLKVEDNTEEAFFHIIGKPSGNVLNLIAANLDRQRDPKIVPVELEELIGNTYTIQVKWRSQKKDNSINDIVVNAIYILRLLLITFRQNQLW